jgi:hypothetical protein
MATRALSGERLLVLGIVTSPLAFTQRHWQRHYYGRMRAPGVHQLFALGNLSGCSWRRHDTEPRALLREERRRHKDFVMLGRAPDCSTRSVAQKTLAWYLHAAELVSAANPNPNPNPSPNPNPNPKPNPNSTMVTANPNPNPNLVARAVIRRRPSAGLEKPTTTRWLIYASCGWRRCSWSR